MYWLGDYKILKNRLEEAHDLGRKKFKIFSELINARKIRYRSIRKISKIREVVRPKFIVKKINNVDTESRRHCTAKWKLCMRIDLCSIKETTIKFRRSVVLWTCSLIIFVTSYSYSGNGFIAAYMTNFSSSSQKIKTNVPERNITNFVTKGYKYKLLFLERSFCSTTDIYEV